MSTHCWTRWLTAGWLLWVGVGQVSFQEKGVVVGQLRRQLSTASIRAASMCLLDRMHQCGEKGSLGSKEKTG